MKERTLESAIQQFRNNIKQSDYVKLGAKGEYLTVPYRIKFVREYFGSRLQLITFSSELTNGSTKFRASALLDGKELSVGESKMMVNRDKEFEKAQTVAVGRCLSILGFMGNEIATAEEIADFVKSQVLSIKIKDEDMQTLQEPGKGKHHVNKDKTFENGHKVNYPKDEPEEEKKIQTKQTTEQMANEWIKVLKTTAEHSKTLGQFENNLNDLRKEYLEELQTIWEDLIQQQRIEDSYISLQKQINNRK